MSASTTVRPRTGSGSSADGPPPRRRRRWVGVLVAVLVVALLGTAGWLVAFSSVLATRQVTVTGNKILSAEEVRAAAQIPLGRPMARQNTDAIAARVAALRPVRSVQVTRSWPRTLVVTVQERTPVLAVAEPTGFTLVDEAGTTYLSVPTVPSGIVQAAVDPSNVLLLTDVGLVARALSPDLAKKVRIIEAGSTDGITLRLRDGDQVIWGSADESVLKAQVVSALLKRAASTYDVSAPHSPSLR